MYRAFEPSSTVTNIHKVFFSHYLVMGLEPQEAYSLTTSLSEFTEVTVEDGALVITVA